MDVVRTVQRVLQQPQPEAEIRGSDAKYGFPTETEIRSRGRVVQVMAQITHSASMDLPSSTAGNSNQTERMGGTGHINWRQPHEATNGTSVPRAKGEVP